ncbi:MAG TPA: hypothetical protein PKC43_09890 [Phycisphaerales bacterium]|nr:hypothetical protein [Phycisphaerales bacterium]HMP37745.1 hypothetical protein [Phycisphaerales bacterium]
MQAGIHEGTAADRGADAAVSAAANRPGPAGARAWPPPSTPPELRAALGEAARPGALAILHAVAAVAIFAATPLGKAPANIAFAALVAAWLIRLPGTLAINAALLRLPLVWAAIAWLAWASLSGLWSPDRDQWADQMGALRALLLVPAIVATPPRWRLWVAALLLGVNAINVVQVLQEAELLPLNPRNPRRHAAYGLHPGHFSTWCGIAVVLSFGAMAQLRGRARWVLAGSAALALAGMAIAAGRGAILGLVVALPIFAALAWRLHGGSALRRSIGPMAAIAAVALPLGLAAFALRGGLDGIRGQIAQLRQVSSGGDVTGAIGQRRLWYVAAIELSREHPARGGGLGFFNARLADAPSIRAAMEEGTAAGRSPALLAHVLDAAHPHSTPLHALVDLGAVGVAIAAALALTILATAFAAARCSPLGVAIFAATILWMVASVFESLHLSGTMTTALALLVAMSIASLLARRSRVAVAG